MSWTVPIQQATFKGVQFDVIAVDETFDKAIAEHTYPYVNGADLEDMGLNAQAVKLQAVCFGEGYYTSYKKLLAAIQTKGADVLVHPVRGRMPNMLLASANLRHDAENINYVALDLTFREATPMQPIFAFEHSVLAKIDGYLNQLETFGADVVAWWAETMEVVAFGHNAKNRVLSQWSAIYGCYEQLTALFGADNSLFSLPMGASKANFVAQSKTALAQLQTLLDSATTKRQFASPLGVKAEFNELMRDLAKGCDVPRLLASGQQQRITSAAQFFAAKSRPHDKPNARLTAQDVKSLHCALHLMSCGVLAKAGVEMIEQQAESLTPAEIEYLCQHIRQHILTGIELVREQQRLAQSEADKQQPNNGIYTACYQLSERLRNMAGEMAQMAIAAINQKPPLMVREVRFNGCLQQVAHDFYGDYLRAAELLRLNPQIRQPNFVEQGTLLNAYAK